MMNCAHRWYAIKDITHIESVAHIRTTDCHVTRTMKHWAFVYISSGQRTFRLYDEDVFIHSGEFFILPPNIPHYGLFVDEHEAYYIHFCSNGQEIAPPSRINAEQIYLPQYGRMPDDVDGHSILDYTARHFMSPFANESFLISQVQALLYQVSYFHQRSNMWKGNSAKLSEEILHYIQDNFSGTMYSGDYEAAFGKTYRQLNDIFTNQYGVTIKQMQISIRINHAKQMLATGYSIVETSRKCGFDDYFYFLKVFRKVTGITPKDYQQKLLINSVF